jgi:hypothetical protein
LSEHATIAAAARNYVKFLVNREGQAVARYKPGFDPLDVEADVSGQQQQGMHRAGDGQNSRAAGGATADGAPAAAAVAA